MKGWEPMSQRTLPRLVMVIFAVFLGLTLVAALSPALATAEELPQSSSNTLSVSMQQQGCSVKIKVQNAGEDAEVLAEILKALPPSARAAMQPWSLEGDKIEDILEWDISIIKGSQERHELRVTVTSPMRAPYTKLFRLRRC